MALAWAVEGLWKRYPTRAGGVVEAARGISLQVTEGTIFGLLGPNGAGKSTTLRCSLGLAEPDAGTCLLWGEAPGRPAARQEVGYAPDVLDFPVGATGRSWLRMLGQMRGLSAREVDARLPALVERVGIAVALDRPVRGYSRGMKQRLTWVQAVLHQPRLLFLDEPTAGLDPLGVADFTAWLQELRDAGVTLVLSTHQLETVAGMCDAVAVLVDGRVAFAGSRTAMQAEGGDAEAAAVRIPAAVTRDPGWQSGWTALCQDFDLTAPRWSEEPTSLAEGYRAVVQRSRAASRATGESD